MNRLTADELEDIKQRNPISDVAAGYTKLRRSGGKLLGPCPVCGGRVSSGRFEVFEKDQSWACYAFCSTGGDVISLVQHVESCDFRVAIERLGGRVEIDAARQREIFEERERKRLAQEKNSADYREAERKRLFRAWKGAVPIHGTVAAAYLEGRGLVLPDRCPGLRFLPSRAYFHGDEIDERGKKMPREIHKGPAMLGAFIRPDGKFGGLHMTWLTSLGDVVTKAEIVDPDSGEILPAKKMRGSKTGAYIAIVLLEEPRRLVIGEGIETVLSVYTAMHQAGRDLDDMAFWAAGDLGNLAGRANKTIAHPTLKRPNGQPQRVPDRFPDPDDPGLKIPDSVEELVLLGDGDSEPFLTECAMERAARRYGREGRSIRIAFAPAGLDFNDVLRAA
ncbi:CHC2 zinc finger [Bradyrhizobium brasilense]|uniref:CHC2 zinc finger n=1 Tax=Bradyrhizobium brasilense TaxID=1419277 RepID=A0A1G6INM1_9BRAD|nr:CHC2 zinc finger domain-containing protein [Bradyrhizobium brasilense]SDC07366.1 CHC2 zinc finger [Bradyrhizobium brasilense]